MANTHDAAHAQHVITPTRTYVMVFLALVVGTILTYFAAINDFGALNTPIALGIAFAKASLVIIFFMGVRYNTPLTKVVVVSGFVWLLIMFGLTMGDYVSTGMAGSAGEIGSKFELRVRASARHRPAGASRGFTDLGAVGPIDPVTSSVKPPAYT